MYVVQLLPWRRTLAELQTYSTGNQTELFLLCTVIHAMRTIAIVSTSAATVLYTVSLAKIVRTFLMTMILVMIESPIFKKKDACALSILLLGSEELANSQFVDAKTRQARPTANASGFLINRRIEHSEQISAAHKPRAQTAVLRLDMPYRARTST